MKDPFIAAEATAADQTTRAQAERINVSATVDGDGSPGGGSAPQAMQEGSEAGNRDIWLN